MKYCTHCGQELVDDAVVCTKCGCSVSSSKSSSDSSVIKTVTKVFMILGCIAGAGAFLIPLAWCIPMTVSYFRKVERHEPISVGFKVCTLLFVNMVAGILMLCDDTL